MTEVLGVLAGIALFILLGVLVFILLALIVFLLATLWALVKPLFGGWFDKWSDWYMERIGR